MISGVPACGMSQPFTSSSSLPPPSPPSSPLPQSAVASAAARSLASEYCRRTGSCCIMRRGWPSGTSPMAAYAASDAAGVALRRGAQGFASTNQPLASSPPPSTVSPVSRLQRSASASSSPSAATPSLPPPRVSHLSSIPSCDCQVGGSWSAEGGARVGVGVCCGSALVTTRTLATPPCPGRVSSAR